jgi:hypothetical protein
VSQVSFTDLGIPVDAVESRTAAICTNTAGGSRVVIAAKGFLLVIDPATAACEQVPYPDHYSEYPYDTFSSRSGMFYVGAGIMFYAFDPFQLTFIDAFAVGSEGELCGFSYAENEQGHIYMASYPESRLYRYRPLERDMICHGSMDSAQKYPSHMAVDAYGWIYIGMGTTKKTIVAFHPQSLAMQILIGEESPSIGLGRVRQGPHYQAYAQIGEQWVRVEHGAIAEQLTEAQLPASLYSGASFDKFHRQLPGEWKVVRHSLADRELTMEHQPTARVKVIPLQYVSAGAPLSPLAVGPDHKIYGTSNHPLHFYSYDPRRKGESKLINWGAQPIQHGAGGNLAAYAVQGKLLIGAAYPGGRLHLYDTSRPMELDDSPNRNPICTTEHADIHRPRCAIALRDGEHVVYGGFPGYGMVGGGLCVYHLPSGEDRLIPHTELIPKLSTVALAEAHDGTLIGGTSIETPGGAEPQATTASLYVLDWSNQTVLRSWQLHKRIREYSLLLIDHRGWIHTLTSCSTYFVWDSVNEIIIHEADLSAWGTIVRQGWQLCMEDKYIYGVLSNAVFRIPLDKLQPERIAIPPGEITAGFVKQDRELLFAISTHLWSYSI